MKLIKVFDELGEFVGTIDKLKKTVVEAEEDVDRSDYKGGTEIFAEHLDTILFETLNLMGSVKIRLMLDGYSLPEEGRRNERFREMRQLRRLEI